MLGEPRDRTGYNLAIVSLGVGLAILLLGICWIAVQNSGSEVSDVFTHRCALEPAIHCRPVLYGHEVSSDTAVLDGFWLALAAGFAFLVGMLVPFSFPALRRDSSRSDDSPPAWEWDGPSLVAILIAIGLSIAMTCVDSLFLFAIASLLLGFLIPSPAWRD